MSSFVGVIVSDPLLQSHFTQVELLGLMSKFINVKNKNGKVTIEDLPPLMVKLKGISETLNEEEVKGILDASGHDMKNEIDFEPFLRTYLSLQSHATAKVGGPKKNLSSFLKAATTTLIHTLNESEKATYVAHINIYLADDPFLKKYLPLDPATNDLFDLAKDGVLLCKLINVAVPNTIDERAINTKRVLNPWERNENHTLCLNSAKAIGCTVVNIGTQDLIEGRPHLLLGLISQIIKIQLLASLNLKKTPQLVELVEDNTDVEELMSLAPEKVLLKWMNFHLKKAGYKKPVTNFSSDVKDGEAYAYLLNVLAPEHCSPSTLVTKDPTERAKLVLDHAERMECKRYLSPKDIVEGSTNLNIAFVAQIFHQRNGLSTDSKKISFAERMTDDVQMSREERCFRLWINSLGIESYVNSLFEDVRTGWTLLEVLDKISPGAVNWKQASKPPIKMPFRKVENCNQVIRIGKQLKFSLVNVAGNDLVQGNKKLILAFLWQLMRCHMLQLLRNLRCHGQGKEMTDADILKWANNKVKSTGRQSRIESFKDKSLSNGIFFLELLSAVEPRVVNWNLVTEGINDDDKKLNATYIISVARKIGCSIFVLPEDIMEVNQKMILTLTASIMYWSLQQQIRETGVLLSPASSTSSFTTTTATATSTPDVSPSPSVSGEDDSSLTGEISSLNIDDGASDVTLSSLVENEYTLMKREYSYPKFEEATPTKNEETDTPIKSEVNSLKIEGVTPIKIEETDAPIESKDSSLNIEEETPLENEEIGPPTKREDSSLNIEEETQMENAETETPTKSGDISLNIEEKTPIETEETPIKSEETDTPAKSEDSSLKGDEVTLIETDKTPVKSEETDTPVTSEDSSLNIEEETPIETVETPIKSEETDTRVESEDSSVKVEEEDPIKNEETLAGE